MLPTLMKVLAFALQLSACSAAASCLDARSCVSGMDETSLLQLKSALDERSGMDRTKGTKAFIFDFDMTISTSHMYNDLSTTSAQWARSHNGERHPYANALGEFTVKTESDRWVELKAQVSSSEPGSSAETLGVEEMSKLAAEGKQSPTNLLVEQFKKAEPWTNEDVKEKIFGGDARIDALKEAMNVAVAHGWQLWVLSFGVEDEINLALHIAGLDFLLPRARVVGRKIDRATGNEQFPRGMRKCDYIHEVIQVDLPVLFDDDWKNLNQCRETDFCRIQFAEHGLSPDILTWLATVRGEAAPW